MNRQTFRNAVDDVAWQKQLRDRYMSEGVPPVPHLDVKRAIVRPVSRHLAEQIIFKYEWLGTMGAGCNRFYGIFFGNYCAGVTCWAVGNGNLITLVKTFRLDGELCYLSRGACVHWSPPGANSKLVSWSCRMEAQRGGKLAIAFSDTDAGEIGTIYQASNWAYVGIGSSWEQWIAPTGRVLTKNTMTSYAKQRGIRSCDFEAACLAEGWKMQRTNPKHRYVFILDKSDKALIDRVERMRQPYPKRVPAVEATEGAPDTNQERAVQIRPDRSILDATGKTPVVVTG